MIEPSNNSLQKSWIVDVQEDTEGHFIQFTEEMLEQTGWKIGDTLEWIDNKNGTWSIKRKEDEPPTNTTE